MLNKSVIGTFSKVDELRPEDFNDKVTELDISFAHIKEIPIQFFTLAVQRLDISYTDLERIPAEFALMKNLTVLSVYACKLVYVSPEIGNLSKLTHLLLSGNQLTRLPKTIKRLALESLYVDMNYLSSVPCSESLTRLNTDYNPGLIGFTSCNLKTLACKSTAARVYAFARPNLVLSSRKTPLESINACSFLETLV